MKSVMLSIRPQWVELIARGVKTLEVRKTRPKLPTPFKCYIYCTKHAGSTLHAYGKPNKRINSGWYGKIIGEFICEKISDICIYYEDLCEIARWKTNLLPQTALSIETISDYFGTHNRGCGWHISNLKIYDQPKELREFSKFGFRGMGYSTIVCGNFECKNYIKQPCYDEPPECKIDGCQLRRAPQSWCYVEELQDE